MAIPCGASKSMFREAFLLGFRMRTRPYVLAIQSQDKPRSQKPALHSQSSSRDTLLFIQTIESSCPLSSIGCSRLLCRCYGQNAEVIARYPTRRPRTSSLWRGAVWSHSLFSSSMQIRNIPSPRLLFSYPPLSECRTIALGLGTLAG